jgi:hypothetical protein
MAHSTSLIQVARHESAVSQIANLLSFHITLNKQAVNSFPLVKGIQNIKLICIPLQNNGSTKKLMLGSLLHLLIPLG